jgi:RimJ/RimL family protein N-acetyltransferase
MVALADSLEVRRLYAHCHSRHAASIRVLKKCGFEFDALLEKHSVFPNLEDAAPQDVHRYVHPSYAIARPRSHEFSRNGRTTRSLQ